MLTRRQLLDTLAASVYAREGCEDRTALHQEFVKVHQEHGLEALSALHAKLVWGYGNLRDCYSEIIGECLLQLERINALTDVSGG